ncbi:hypothetical protein K435DRAFT_884763 [Dendrothele bispora CBS 962.96]|uniref:Fungal N-terminal domain-containing protein n=1 Tax=Dendrothele bispora (strain CBS 962.96) TaxID=1314807 RepID=A0A4S8KUK6_DENBC|nr:hypothetical protein K435DRAFT_884763 [Dendrothele bispora CBS 962.96]
MTKFAVGMTVGLSAVTACVSDKDEPNMNHLRTVRIPVGILTHIETLAVIAMEATLTSSTVLSQLDNTQSEAVTQGYTFIVLAVLFSAGAVFRLRYPCLTLSSLKKFVDKLDDIVQRFAEEGGSIGHFRIDVSSLRRNIDDIEYERNNNIFLWSSVHRYLRSSFFMLRKIIKCYDEARELQVFILNAITHRRRALGEFEDHYRRNLSVQGNTELSTAIGYTT